MITAHEGSFYFNTFLVILCFSVSVFRTAIGMITDFVYLVP